MFFTRFGVLLVVLCWCMDMTQAQTARSALSPPHDVLLYIDSEMKDLDFVEPLVCALRQVLTAGIETKTFLAAPNQFDVGKVSDRFAQAAVFDGNP
jgi:hypothetical protein